ncbi:uncharacterized protein LOC127245114 isoform X2 [Andrographis paniculata]|uniref:uncharacterized protein LOC127245114 isoform X2 n=1 Tax=Andrographis paniculata TaxID=175694 RepID=UPI0021E819BD|nr:uncharacterized protein LOC127245114 isoform X2 [Andrographis paniculata]
MEKEEDNEQCPKVANRSSGLISDRKSLSNAGAGSQNGGDDCSSMSTKNPQGAAKFISSVAAKMVAQPISFADPLVWGVLTAISDKARKRNQGMHLLLTKDEHCIGRLVDDSRFQILETAVSGSHCKIFRTKVTTEDAEPLSDNFSVFLKDTSTNGSFLNWKKLTKSGSEEKLNHGDIISLPYAPHHALAYAFVYREVQKSSCIPDDGSLKRKSEQGGTESKRLKGIGIGASEGPISLDDFRSLQRSNKELRKSLENQVATVESLRSDSRAAIEKHAIEMRELKESVSKSYHDQLIELKQSLEAKEKELSELNRVLAEQKHGIEDLTERLSASTQSCHEANEIINSQKASISELKVLLDEERDQRREERDKASADMKMAIHRVQAEAAEEIKQLSDSALRRENELQEMIHKLQEVEKERCSLVEVLRSKLEDTRQKLVNSEYKVRLLEGQIHQEQQASTCSRKRVEELEHERKMLEKELENEKAAREEAWAKVSALELEISAAMRDLDFERRRLKGARERIMLRETQLRAFYSTTEEISVLFAKQQEQLKSMQKTLEDEENYENTSIDIDLNADYNQNRSAVRGEEKDHQSKSIAKAGSGSQNMNQSSSDAASATEKHDCNSKSQDNNDDTQEVEFNGGFGSDVNGVGTAPILAGETVGTEQVPDTEVVGARLEATSHSHLSLLADVVSSQNLEGDGETEQVLETQGLGVKIDNTIDLNKFDTPAMDEMQVDSTSPVRLNTNNFGLHQFGDDDTMEADDNSVAPEKAPEDAQPLYPDTAHNSQSNRAPEAQDAMEDTEDGKTIKTCDLLASEVAGSWACSTAPSVHGENNGETVPAHDSGSVVAESQHVPSSTNSEAAARRKREREALSEMIGIVAPELKEQFSCAVGSDNRSWDKRDTATATASNSDTEDCSDKDNIEASDAEAVDSHRLSDGEHSDDEDAQEDSESTSSE